MSWRPFGQYYRWAFQVSSALESAEPLVFIFSQIAHSDDKNLEVSGNKLQERASVVLETWASAAAFSQQLRGCIGCLSLSRSS